ncbi:MAG: 16S rRNA (cytosine(1402)-N(4))-methyltransferase RsmH [Janthinobacterium lividum]
MSELPFHVPVMLREVLSVLQPQPGGVFLDCTLGGGGHAQALLEKIMPGGRLIGIDQDLEALTEAGERLAQFGPAVILRQARFDDLGSVLDSLGIDRVDGALFDLGVSSHQLDTPERGFSFKEPEALLDMRMNPASQGPTAADLLNTLGERELSTLIRENSDEHWAARIARFAVERRQKDPFRTVGQLIETVHAAIPVKARPEDKHAATRTFQALRIAVNDELTILGHALESAVDRLTKGGTAAALSYHSLEDKIVKQSFAHLSGRGPGEGIYGAPPPAIVELLTRKPTEPESAEVAANPRARSARLRAVRKL